jgi:hypothetical protein
MWTAECSGTNCSAIQTCTPLAAPNCTNTTLAPDHWLIEDMEARMTVGNTTNAVPVNVQRSGTETIA